jgi:4-hydroxy-3-methylbut-2-enyl diphosphate reductase IspH
MGFEFEYKFKDIEKTIKNTICYATFKNFVWQPVFTSKVTFSTTFTSILRSNCPIIFHN